MSSSGTPSMVGEVCGTLVTGDFIIDQHIYEGDRHHYADRSPGVRVKVEVGGAGMLAALLKVLFDKFDPVEFQSVRNVAPARVPPGPLESHVSGTETATPLAHHAYAFWRRSPEGEPREKQHWRCVEAMGFGDNPPGSPAPQVGSEAGANETPAAGDACVPDAPCASWNPHPDAPRQPAILVFSEGGMGFRDTRACWETEALAAARHIILKTASQPTASDLWDVLTEHADRLTVVISAAELRKYNARISAGLTWEETFKDLLRELSKQGSLHALTNCRNLIVTFDNEAAAAVQFVVPGRLDDALVTFVYRPETIEEDARNETSGTAFGFLTCFAAAVTRAIARGEEADLAPALSEGLSAMRNLLREGHGPGMEPPKGFPTERIAGAILDPQEHFTEVRFQHSEVAAADWTFLQLAEPSATSRTDAAFEFARLTAIYGPVAIANLPHLRIGEFVSVDGEEITALRNLRRVVRQYDRHDDGRKPLSIGVFGPPGAGKSFAVRQIANSLLGKRSHWLEFNLSQFKDANDLIGAFHQVRDQVLQGKLPVAFFDEFDSHDYRWLKYLLAPMQDGRFQEGELTHTIGKCVFIFAGGTSWTFDTFGPRDASCDGRHGDATTASAEFRLAKGPDFQSRLDAYLNVVGPNPRVREQRPNEGTTPGLPGDAGQAPPSYQVGGRTMAEDDRDIWWPIRRALMLRSILKLKPDTKLKIDPGLLHALLHVSRYRHGSRSIEKVLLPMQKAGGFSPSSLPHRSQLELHTNADEFLKLLCVSRRPAGPAPVTLNASEIRTMSAAIHETWNRVMVRSGARRPEECRSLEELHHEWQNKRQTLETSEQELHAAQCSDAMKERERQRVAAERKKIPSELTKIRSNDAAGRRIAGILEIIGLALVRRGRPDGDDIVEAVRRRIEFHLELLASEEHRGWMDWYLAQGWTYHPKRNDVQSRHNCLKPYSELPDPERMKDRMSVRQYPAVARAAGFRIEDVAGAADAAT